MTTLLKIRGLDRDNYAETGQVTSGRGFRVPVAYGVQYPHGGQAASEIVGTVGAPNAAVQYTAKYAGTAGNNLRVVQNAPSGSTRIIALTFASSTGNPTLTITPTSTDTAATLVAAVNADYTASQYVVASLVGTGASAPVASADANAVVSIAQATGTSTSGTFTLTFPGFGTTAAIAYGAAGSVVATAVQAVTSGTVTGSGTTLPSTTTLTFSGGLAATPVANPTVNNAANVGGTYSATTTTYGRAAAGTFSNGLNTALGASGNSVGVSQAIYATVSGKSIVVVDLDNALTLRQLYRMKSRWVSLGQP